MKTDKRKGAAVGVMVNSMRTIETSKTLKRLNKYTGEIYGAGVIARRFTTLYTVSDLGCGLYNDGTPRPLNWLWSEYHPRKNKN